MFKDNADFRKYLPISNAFSLEEVQYAINKALENHIYTVIPENQIDSLLTDYEANTLTGVRLKVFKYLQEVVANFCIYYHTDFANIKYSEAGLHVIVTDREKPINLQEKNTSKRVCFLTAITLLDKTLQKMEANKADFSLWSGSETYTVYHSNFIRNANEFSQYVNIGQSRLLFLQLKNSLQEQENIELPNILGLTLYQEMQNALKTNSLNLQQELLRHHIIPYIARKVMSKNIVTLNLTYEGGFMKLSYNELTNDAIKENKDNKHLDALIRHYESEAESRLVLLVKFLNDNLNHFPSFALESKFYAKPQVCKKSLNNQGSKSFWL